MKRTILTLAVASALALTACSAPATQPAAAPDATGVSTPLASTAAAVPAGMEPNGRGNFASTVGATEKAYDPSDGTDVGDFTVTGIKPGVCVGNDIAENGKFVFVDINAKAMSSNGNRPFYMNSGGGVLTVIKADGTTWNGTPTTAQCLPTDQTLRASVKPGEKVAGTIVLDVPNDAATLIYRPTLDFGYEYALP